MSELEARSRTVLQLRGCQLDAEVTHGGRQVGLDGAGRGDAANAEVGRIEAIAIHVEQVALRFKIFCRRQELATSRATEGGDVGTQAQTTALWA